MSSDVSPSFDAPVRLLNLFLGSWNLGRFFFRNCFDIVVRAGCSITTSLFFLQKPRIEEICFEKVTVLVACAQGFNCKKPILKVIDDVISSCPNTIINAVLEFTLKSNIVLVFRLLPGNYAYKYFLIGD